MENLKEEDAERRKYTNMPPEEEARIDNLMAERWDMPELKKDMSKFKRRVSFN